MVDINVALPDPNSLLNGKSVPSISFKDAKVGDSYNGTITALETAQVRNYESGEPEFWEDGNPKLQIVVTLATTYGDGAEDDGERKVYLFGQKLQAAKAALKEAGLTKLEIGSSFTITYSGTKPSSNKKYNDVKLYTIAIVKGTSNPAVDTLLAQGAKPAAEGDKLSAEQIAKVNKLSEAGFSDEEIAETMGVNKYAVVSALESNKPF
jgi:uncharacterized protein with beta-barrel porin domain